MPQPKRYVISATLVTCSPLAIHSGLGSEEQRAMGLLPTDLPFREKSPWNAEKLDSCDRLVMRDGNGLPYIPGSSLKGVFREFLTRDTSDSDTDHAWLLGTESPPNSTPDGSDQGSGGAAVFEDAFLDTHGECVQRQQTYFQQLHRQWFFEIASQAGPSTLSQGYAADRLVVDSSFPKDSLRKQHDRVALLTDTRHLPYWDPASLTYVEHQIGIDRRTGTVGEGKLFTSEVVPTGMPFRVRLIVDHDLERALPATKRLLRALAGFNLDPVHAPIQLGAGTQHGWGRLVCLFPTIVVQAWSSEGVRDVEPEEINVQAELTDGLTSPPMPRKPRVQIELQLNFQGPFLVNDPAKVCVLEAVDEGLVKSGDESHPNNPDHVPRVAGVRIDLCDCGKRLLLKPLLPGTSVKGPIRAQLERILRTLNPKVEASPHGGLYPVCDKSPEFVKQLLGYQSHRSGLWCSEFVGDEKQGGWAKREMVAIDRFTGGASDHAKFDAIVLDRPTLRGLLAIDLPMVWNEAQKTLGLVILMLRDLLEGDIAFGLGDMKGFGQCTAEIRSVQMGGLPHCEEHIRNMTDQEIEANVNEWFGKVRHALLEYRQSAERPGSPSEVLKVANQLIDACLQTLPLRTSDIPVA